MKLKPYICSAIGTPLDVEEQLDPNGLRAHFEDQARAGIHGVLVGGTMGAMPLLTWRTYEQLVRASADYWPVHGELLVGVSDLSFARTRERIQLVNELPIDGAVALAPYFLSYSQADLIQYFEALAAESRAPLFLYDLPQRTGIALTVETVLRLSEHPNIAGIKCSGDLSEARRLIDSLRGSDFRVIVAQAPLLDVLLRTGMNQHVDGVYCLVPQLTRRIAEAATRGDGETAAELTRRLCSLLLMLRKYGVFPAMTALLNTRGISGSFAPRPHQPLTSAVRESLLAEGAVRDALTFEESPVAAIV
ncbi:MAG: dihydrodipicolinate synthase family protein [Pirellulales bacterium]